MTAPRTEDRQKLRRERAKRAVALAMQSRWMDAVAANELMLIDFPDDLEAYNRLGKALTELGRAREAKAAFQRAIEISPYNAIARKNLGRLMQLGDDSPRGNVQGRPTPNAFIEESGKAGVTSLVNLAPTTTLLKMAPGHPVHLLMDGAGLKVADVGGACVGQVEPKLASRLTRLMKGGNRYGATVTSVGEQELTVIIRELYQEPSQSGTASFPSKGADYRVYMPGTIMGYDLADEETEEVARTRVKDWSDDDTEPGDDDVFKPVAHRIINSSDE